MVSFAGWDPRSEPMLSMRLFRSRAFFLGGEHGDLLHVRVAIPVAQNSVIGGVAMGAIGKAAGARELGGCSPSLLPSPTGSARQWVAAALSLADAIAGLDPGRFRVGERSWLTRSRRSRPSAEESPIKRWRDAMKQVIGLNHLLGDKS